MGYWVIVICKYDDLSADYMLYCVDCSVIYYVL